MKLILKISIVLLSVITLFSCSNMSNPPGLLYDEAGILNSKENEIISKFLESHNNKGPGIITILIINELPDGVSIEKFAYDFNNALNNLDNGPQERILFLVSVKDRKLRLETSKDIQGQLTDDECSNILDNIVTPEFKKEQYFEGINLGLAAIISELEN